MTVTATAATGDGAEPVEVTGGVSMNTGAEAMAAPATVAVTTTTEDGAAPAEVAGGAATSTDTEVVVKPAEAAEEIAATGMRSTPVADMKHMTVAASEAGVEPVQAAGGAEAAATAPVTVAADVQAHITTINSTPVGSAAWVQAMKAVIPTLTNHARARMIAWYYMQAPFEWIDTTLGLMLIIPGMTEIARQLRSEGAIQVGQMGRNGPKSWLRLSASSAPDAVSCRACGLPGVPRCSACACPARARLRIFAL